MQIYVLELQIPCPNSAVAFPRVPCMPPVGYPSKKFTPWSNLSTELWYLHPPICKGLSKLLVSLYTHLLKTMRFEHFLLAASDNETGRHAFSSRKLDGLLPVSITCRCGNIQATLLAEQLGLVTLRWLRRLRSQGSSNATSHTILILSCVFSYTKWYHPTISRSTLVYIYIYMCILYCSKKTSAQLTMMWPSSRQPRIIGCKIPLINQSSSAPGLKHEERHKKT